MGEGHLEPFVIRLVGDWDLARKEELGAILAQAYERPDVILDLSETQYIDSTALAEFAKMRKHRVEKRGFEPSQIVVPPGNIAKLLGIVGFDKVFPTFASMREALQGHPDPGEPLAQADPGTKRAAQ
ncbi:MAG: STAS domain-containing protein [Candidatus Eremiobacteraeota bacterium]|nr:STAS domain-containing protein [Candidatus Eremiobacteraeota bacterium]